MTSNVSLVRLTCAASGDLLQPSYPLVPLDRTLVAARGSALPNSVQLWGTYTALAADVAHVWYVAMAFCMGCSSSESATATVAEADLAPMVDAAAVAPSFDDVPRGAAFAGNGSRFDAAGGAPLARVAWRADVLRQSAAAGCENVKGLRWAIFW